MKLLKEERPAHAGKNLQCQCPERCLQGTDSVSRFGKDNNKPSVSMCSTVIWLVYTRKKLFYCLQPNYVCSSISGRNSRGYRHQSRQILLSVPAKFILISTALNRLIAMEPVCQQFPEVIYSESQHHRPTVCNDVWWQHWLQAVSVCLGAWFHQKVKFNEYLTHSRRSSQT